jgi:hypothetical protein
VALTQREAFARTMEHLCNHDSHGYTQGNRWGNGTTETIDLGDGVTVNVTLGDRDCSSAIISALQAVGVDTGNATYTGNMKTNILNSGLFVWWSIDNVAQRGDIYLNEQCHTAMCTSAYGSAEGDILAEFSCSEDGTAYGNEGDQTGYESHICAYYDYPWDGILHWKSDGQTLDGGTGSRSNENSDRVHLWDANNSDDQKFALEWCNDNTFMLKSVSTGLYLDVCSGNATSGTSVQVYSGNGTDAQKWRAVQVGGGYAPSFVSPVYIVPILNENLALDCVSGGTENDTGIQIYEKNTTGAQQWQVLDHGDGTWTLINVNSSKALDVENE